jgi:2-iminobutanoate/2-iminopropanoate deaminase
MTMIVSDMAAVYTPPARLFTLDEPMTQGAPMAPDIQSIDPAELPEPSAAYTHGTLVRGAERLVFVSGQPPWAVDEPVPQDFDAQCRLAWRNVETVLTEAGLTLHDLAKVTVYLSDRRYREVNSRIRAEVLGDHRPAITIVITGIYSEEWLLEIEAIAAG